jgi:hypothetical protein
MLLEPKEITVKTLAGEERVYIISKFPAVAGREIFAQYPLSLLPKIGDYAVNEKLMLKILGYVAVPRAEAEPLALTSRALVDNHVPDWEALARIELAVMDYNCSFFASGKASTFLAGLGTKAASRVTEILTGLLASLSPAARPASRN